jgi:AraC-like DNA-binding protein
MPLLKQAPHLPLDEFVELVWLFEPGPAPPSRLRFLPAGGFVLIVDLELHGQGSLLCGAHSKPFEINFAGTSPFLGVHFKPGGASPFLGVPAADLNNQCVPLQELWGSRADDLLNEVLTATTFAARVQILASSLLTQHERLRTQHPAVAYALTAFRSGPCVPNVVEVANHVGLSRRRFIEVFTAEVGLTPKVCSRVFRFQRALQLCNQADRLSWADIALASGYYDQAHFITEFRQFSGLTPAVYVLQRTPHIELAPLSIFPVSN